MKTGARQIIGKTITGVIIKRTKGSEIPRTMLFITFDDGTYYEFYSMNGEILNTGGVVVSGGFTVLLQYLQDTHGVDFCAIRSPDSGEVSVRVTHRRRVNRGALSSAIHGDDRGACYSICRQRQCLQISML